MTLADSGADPTPPCRPLGLWATLGWGAAGLVVWFAAQVALAVTAPRWLGGAENAAGNALILSIVVIGAMPVALAVLAIAARTARCGFVEFLALRWPTSRHVLIGLAGLAVLIPLVDLFSWLAGRDVSPSFVIALYRNARETGMLPLLVLALAGATPLVEETLFRGLLLPGLAATRLGPAAAIVLTSAGWTVLHLQYEPFYLIQAMALGVLFGWMRWRSGSTLLTVFLHGLVNLTSVVQAGVIVEWLS